MSLILVVLTGFVKRDSSTTKQDLEVVFSQRVIKAMSQSGNPKILFSDCDETVATYKDGFITVYSQKSGVEHKIPVEWVFEAIRQGKGKGMEKLQIFIADNHCIFG